MCSHDELANTVQQLQQQVQSLQNELHCGLHQNNSRQAAYTSHCYKFDPELTSIPYWYRNSPIFQYQPSNNYHNYHPPSIHPTPAYQHYYNHKLRETPSHHTFQPHTNLPNKHKSQTQTKKKKNKNRGKKQKLDINNQETLTQLGVSTELMNFFYNGEIRRNRLRIEKFEKEKAEIESSPTIKQQQIIESRRRNKLYGKRNNYKLKQKETSMDTMFMKTLDSINSNTNKNQKLVTWPATPLSY